MKSPLNASFARKGNRVGHGGVAWANAECQLLEDRRLLSGITAITSLGFTVFSGVGTAQVTAAIAAYQAAIGGVDNGNTAAEQASGSRRINWDGVALDGTDFGGLTKTIIPNKLVGIPVNRFQTRGALFGEVYAVSGDGFASANSGVVGQLIPFSAKNIFGHFNDIDTSFIKPSGATTTPVQQATRGFGAVFLDVEQANSSYIEYKNGANTLAKVFLPKGASGQPEFLGVLFNAPVVTEVNVSPGTAPLFFSHNGQVAAGQKDITNGGLEDMAAVDDFLYAEPTTPIHPAIFHETEGATFSATVGSFITTNASPKASGFTATINWGDGTTSAGVISLGGSGRVGGQTAVGTPPASPITGGFVIKGTHTYAEEGTFNISVKITDKLGDVATAYSVATVADAPLHGAAVTFNATTLTAFNGAVGFFKDDDTGETDPLTYTALINWGDGISTVGTLVLTSAGQWAVRGIHQYAKAGKFTVNVIVTDVGGSVADILSTATVI